MDALRQKTPASTSKSSGEKKDSVPSLKTPGSTRGRTAGSGKRLQELLKRRTATKNEAPGTEKGGPNRARVSKAIKPAEVHFIGELTGCSGFGDGVSCRWTLDYGESWKLTSKKIEDKKEEDEEDNDEGEEEKLNKDKDKDLKTSLSDKMTEQTHYAYGSAYGEPVWGHPLDFQCKSNMLTGWPRLLLEVFKLDQYGRNDLVGYGVVDLPKTCGTHELECNTWRPRGDRQTEYAAFFLGGHPRLSQTGLNVLFRDAWESRMELVTIPSGTVYLQIDVLLRNVTEESMKWLH